MKMFIDAKVEDPLARSEFYKTFPPRNENEMMVAEQAINKEKSAKRLQADREQFEDEHQNGINLR
ncbi:conserved hypothetical protein [delta proteobacterium NaphS2]|nr:conserved hypothetical protein [delta proteobacterium NaphS2]